MEFVSLGEKSSVSNSFRKLIEKCLNRDPKKRPSMEYLFARFAKYTSKRKYLAQFE